MIARSFHVSTAIVSSRVRSVVCCVKLSVRYHVVAYLSCIARMIASPSAGIDAAGADGIAGDVALEPARVPPAGASSAATNATRAPAAEDRIMCAPLLDQQWLVAHGKALPLESR